MKPRLFFLIALLLVLPFFAKAQTTYLPLRSPAEHLLNHLETKSGQLSPYFFGLRPIARKEAMAYIKKLKESMDLRKVSLSKVDKYDIRRAQSISSEWVTTADGMDGAIPSKIPIFNTFYKVQPDAVHVHTDNFFLAVNPVIYAELIKEKGEKFGYFNTRGIEVRGRIAHKIGFYTMLADDQERPPSFIWAYAQHFQSFPGKTFYQQSNANNFDLFLGRGYVDVPFFKEHLKVTFGYGKNFTGVGMRSLINSDFSPPATFLRLRAHWKRFIYQSLFLQLTADYGDRVVDHRISQKYAAIHQIGYRVRHWLNIGLFETTMFAGKDNLKASDLIPVIGYQTVAQSLGAKQRTAFGLWYKAIALRHLQFYGQAYFNRLNFAKIMDNGFFGNQIGFQVGGKYFDAFSVSNLFLQGEVNLVRPFTYASDGDNTGYVHYQQPLAHPFGAGFGEVIGKIRYQPLNKLYLSAKALLAVRGSDADSATNNGINPMKNMNTRNGDYGYGWVPGSNRTGFYVNVNIDYEIRPMIFLELGAGRWQTSFQSKENKSLFFYGGIRWNITRTRFDGVMPGAQ